MSEVMQDQIKTALLDGLIEQSEVAYDGPCVQHMGESHWLIDGWVDIDKLAGFIQAALTDDGKVTMNESLKAAIDKTVKDQSTND